VSRLEAAGIVQSERVGNARLVRPDPASPVHAELAALLAKAFGPAPYLESALSKVPGVEHAYIFGSWARRFGGESGPLPRDVDVLVVGSPDPDAVYRVARDVGGRLGIDVNPVLLSAAEWSEPGGLARRVRQGPVVELELSGDDR
jgi:predicted nucleotidyltransferase